MTSLLFNISSALANRQTTLRRELLAGLTTFFTLAYISIVASNLLGLAGFDQRIAFLAVCFSAGIGSVLSGLLGGYPIALAPGLGLLSYFVFVVIGQLHYSPEAGLAMLGVSGLLFLAVSLTRLRFLILNAIPASLGYGITAGIGFFIALIALRNAGFVVSNPDTGLSLGHLSQPSVILFILTFFGVWGLSYYSVPGAFLIALAVGAAIGHFLGLTEVSGLIAWPSHLFQYFGHQDFQGVFQWQSLSVIFTFLMVALFDSTGTLISLTRQFSASDFQKRMRGVFLAESLAIILAASLGCSSVTAMLENAAGIRAGGRTGLVAIVVGLGFLLLLFCGPLAHSVPAAATSAVLFYVACLMLRSLEQISWADVSEYFPSILVTICIPFTFSIVNGVGFGLLTHVILKLLSRQHKSLSLGSYLLALVFLVYFCSLA